METNQNLMPQFVKKIAFGKDAFITECQAIVLSELLTATGLSNLTEEDFICPAGNTCLILGPLTASLSTYTNPSITGQFIK
jgi:hypothetical protein